MTGKLPHGTWGLFFLDSVTPIFAEKKDNRNNRKSVSFLTPRPAADAAAFLAYPTSAPHFCTDTLAFIYGTHA